MNSSTQDPEAEHHEKRRLELESIRLANQDLEHIRILQQSEAFNKYFLRRIRDRIKVVESIILEEVPGNEEREHLSERGERKALVGITKMLEADAAGCRNILNLDESDAPCTPQ